LTGIEGDVERRLDSPTDIADLERSFHLLQVDDEAGFNRYRELALAYQRSNNPVYARFSPFEYLPVRAFKDADVACFPLPEAETVFVSSGTGDARERSRHHVRRLEIYERAVTNHFSSVFGTGPLTFLFCTPENDQPGARSSLVAMTHILSRCFGSRLGGYLTDSSFDARGAVTGSTRSGYRIVVFGTAFGLMDYVELPPLELPPDAIVVETGGMKTHRREIERADLHAELARGFGLEAGCIRSEYGMCELMSQFYTGKDGLFYGPPWVRFRVVKPDDPLEDADEGQPGALAVFDLANLHSVCGVLTEDRAVRRGKGFELLGRLSGAELRGCNFLLEDRR